MSLEDVQAEPALAKANVALFDEMGLPSEHRGGRAVPRFSPELAARLHASLLDGFARAERLGQPGGLHVAFEAQEEVFWGFDQYAAVQAPLDNVEQRKVTTLLPVAGRDGERHRRLICGGLDGLEALIEHAKAAAGTYTLLSCFVLRQDSAQARFAWHQDNNFPFTKLTIVYLLTEGSSTMKVAGFDDFVYEGQGCGVAFPSAAHHRSGGCSHAGTVKVTFFAGEEIDPEVLFYMRKVKLSDGGGQLTGVEVGSHRDRDWVI